ncbi:MAG: hypothetical protein ABI980_04315 [Nitrospirota bacterium]
MVGPDLVQVFSHVPSELKEEMILIASQHRDWSQAEIIRVALMRFMPELKKELASPKGRFHTVRHGITRKLRSTKVSKAAGTGVVTRLMDAMEHITERLEQLEARNRTASKNQTHL